MSRLVALLLALTAYGGIARAQEEGGRPTMRAVPLKEGESVTLDGRLESLFGSTSSLPMGFASESPMKARLRGR